MYAPRTDLTDPGPKEREATMFEGKCITSIHYTGGLVAGQTLQIVIHYTGGAILFTDPDDVSKIAAWIRKALKLQADPCSYLQYMFTEEGL